MFRGEEAAKGTGFSLLAARPDPGRLRQWHERCAILWNSSTIDLATTTNDRQ
jgi:hypothetical protein